MPELPEVETIRRGLLPWVRQRQVTSVEVHHPRSVRMQPGGATELAAGLVGARVTGARRRGKYLWLPLDTGDALLVHLGMSGQLRVEHRGTSDGGTHPHLRARVCFGDDGPDLLFVDQRTFGHVLLSFGGAEVPTQVAHIAADPLAPEFDGQAVLARWRSSDREVKRVLLDQTVVSGIGNIYADEALWLARLHWARPTSSLAPRDGRGLLAAVSAVLRQAVAAGGTSFDGLYVDVDGRGGYFARELAVYGREGQPCLRCGTAIRRERFLNRSSHRCPRCQRSPRGRG